MLFFPYRFDMHFMRVPYVTIVVGLVCLGVYSAQFSNEIEFVNRTTDFCASINSNIERMMLTKISAGGGAAACEDFIYSVRLAEDADMKLDELAAAGESFAGLSEADSIEYTRELMQNVYDRHLRAVPPLQTKELWYHPHSWDPWTMVTASFAHGSWDHVIGNLIFFSAFAAAVEIIVGPLLYLAIIAVMVVGTGISYSLAMMNVADALPTVGLSGVVMGMMAMLTFFVPLGRIRCFYWFLIKIGTVTIPVWMLALWYIGFDAYQLFVLEDQSGVNLVYHVSGAALGLLIGVMFFRQRRVELAEQMS